MEVIKKIEDRFVPAMDSGKFFERQRASRDAETAVVKLSRRIAPPTSGLWDVLHPRRESLSPEQSYRLDRLRRFTEMHAASSDGPTRIPIQPGMSLPELLDMLSLQSGMTIRFEDPERPYAAPPLTINPHRNSFGEIVQSICRHTGTLPHVVQDEHFVLELREKNGPGQEILLDDRGVLLGVFGEAGERGPTLDIFCDPNFAMIEIVSAETTGERAITIRIHPTMTPLWRSVEMPGTGGQPTLEMRTKQGEERGEGDLRLQIGMQRSPRTVDIPLQEEEVVAGFGPAQFLWMHSYNEETGEAHISLQHPEDQSGHHFWTEMRALTPQFTFFDAAGNPLPTVARSLEYHYRLHPPHFTMVLAAEGKAYTLRVRAYTDQDDYLTSDRKDHRFSFHDSLRGQCFYRAKE